MSIGDSLLDYLTKEEIKKNTIIYDDSSTDTTYSTVEIGHGDTSLNLNFYEDLILTYKSKDNKFILYSVDGAKNIKNMNDCYKEMNSAIKDISKSLAKIKPTQIKTVNTNLGTWKGAKFIFKSGDYISVKCLDYDKEIYEDHLRISILRLEYMEWINAKAYK
tara:strand:- start:50 stop:535 length:486 start_codon:yes stop_codon:yes gene_type:complete